MVSTVCCGVTGSGWLNAGGDTAHTLHVIAHIAGCLQGWDASGGGCRYFSSTLALSSRPISVHTSCHPPFSTLSTQQDAWAVKEHIGKSQHVMFGVFDGHGPEGKTIANIISTALPKLVAAALPAMVVSGCERDVTAWGRAGSGAASKFVPTLSPQPCPNCWPQHCQL